MLRISEEVLTLENVIRAYDEDPQQLEIKRNFHFDIVDHFIIDYFFNTNESFRLKYYVPFNDLKKAMNDELNFPITKRFINERLFHITNQRIHFKQPQREFSGSLFTDFEYVYFRHRYELQSLGYETNIPIDREDEPIALTFSEVVLDLFKNYTSLERE